MHKHPSGNMRALSATWSWLSWLLRCLVSPPSCHMTTPRALAARREIQPGARFPARPRGCSRRLDNKVLVIRTAFYHDTYDMSNAAGRRPLFPDARGTLHQARREIHRLLQRSHPSHAHPRPPPLLRHLFLLKPTTTIALPVFLGMAPSTQRLKVRNPTVLPPNVDQVMHLQARSALTAFAFWRPRYFLSAKFAPVVGLQICPIFLPRQFQGKRPLFP